MNFKKITANTLFALMTLTSSLALGNPVEDTAITSAVKAALVLEKDIPAQSIEVTTNNGVVSLKGALDTKLQADKAVEVVSGVSNVVDVTSDLNVKGSSESITADSIVTAKIKGRIASLLVNNKISAGYDLHVETTDGVPHIHGTVTKKEDIETVAAEAKKVKGVKSVNTNIEVKS